MIASAPDRNQKIIVRAQDRRGAARAILRSASTGAATTRSSARPARSRPASRLCPGRAPELFAAGERAGKPMAQEFLQGTSGGLRITDLHADMLEELAGAGRRSPSTRSAPSRPRSAASRASEPSFDPDWHDAYQALARALADATGDRTLPVHAAHGDFVPWNLTARAGQLRAFDWEHSELRAPALHDLVHFHVQTGALASETPGERVFDGLRSLFAGPGGRVVRALGISSGDVLRLVSLHVLQMGVTSEVIERLRPAPLIESVRLRRVRLALCVRLAGLLAERRLPEWCLVPAAPPPEQDERRLARVPTARPEPEDRHDHEVRRQELHDRLEARLPEVLARLGEGRVQAIADISTAETPATRVSSRRDPIAPASTATSTKFTTLTWTRSPLNHASPPTSAISPIPRRAPASSCRPLASRRSSPRQRSAPTPVERATRPTYSASKPSPKRKTGAVRTAAKRTSRTRVRVSAARESSLMACATMEDARAARNAGEIEAQARTGAAARTSTADEK